MVFIYTTCATPEEAKRLGKLILEKKMGACVDYWPVDSMFHWKDGIKQISQVMLSISTFENKLEAVNDLISEHHSYSVPMIAGVDVRRINRAYRGWMTTEVDQ